MQTATTTTVKDVRTALERWHAIPYQARLIGLVSILYFLGGLAIILRPITGLAVYWEAVLGIQSDAMALLFFACALTLPLVYYLWRKLIFVGVASFPALLVLFLGYQQVFTSSKEPLLFVWSNTAVVVLIIVLFYITSELQTLDRANEELAKELMACQKAPQTENG